MDYLLLFKTSIFVIQVKQAPIEFGPLTESTLPVLLETTFSRSKKIILVDENTHTHCLEYLLTQFEALTDAEVIVIPAGETNKTIEVAAQVCMAFKDYEIGRNDVLINLGGGMVTDMGGFIASIYNRGISCIHIPTTLLGMVDAAIGGKTGVDLEGAKNIMGTFYQPKAIYIDQGFLFTLPYDQWLNGYAEMLKHALIADLSLWDNLKGINEFKKEVGIGLIRDCATIKLSIVREDPMETGKRKNLNFGHTIGHAIEGVLMDSERALSHGHAVALGMIAESYLSMKLGLLSQKNYQSVETHLKKSYSLITLTSEDVKKAVAFARLDKKNTFNKINVVLLRNIGEVSGLVEIDEAMFVESLTKITN
jgi:3-dehydroquinate synthase